MIQVQQNINIPSFSKEDLHYHSMSESKKNAESEASTLDVPFELPITQVVAHTEKLKSPCMPSQNTPSTPSSFKVSRSDASESSHDTNPSSIEQHDLPADEEHLEEGGPTHIQENAQSTALLQPTNNPQTTSQTLHSIQVTVDTLAFASQSQSNGAQRSPSPTSHAPHVPEIKPSSRVLNNLISEDRPTGSRRHTLPIGGSIEQSRASFDIATGTATGNYFANRTSISSVASANRTSFQLVRQLKPSRNTFPAYNSEPDVLKVRNSLVAKRLKKKRRGDLDDDKVLVGNKISEGHENFVMAYNMLTGIRVAVSRCSGVMQKLSDADFNSLKKLSFNMDGSELTPSSKYDFKFKDYCPEVFREMRSMFGLDPADYLVSITGKYILSELGSPGKSGSFFYYSRDFRFIIKTIHHLEHKQLRRILKDYYNHVKENPNTLISQFYGLHRVKMPFSRQGGGSRKVHFVVMNNLFPPHRDIHLKYDLKGSTWGRITKTAEGEDISQTTLKDLNWLERKETIKFGPEKKKLFFEQLERDVKLLKKINVMDYSLLLGVHDVKRGNTFDLLTKLSVFDPKSLNKSELIKTNPRGIDPELDLPSNVFPGRSQYVFYGHDGGIRSTGEQNEPLQQIYYLGIIDCLTLYSTKKRLETFWRSMFHTRLTISAIPAKEYGDRFMKFIKKGTV